jgi:hypothetical protein
MIQLIIHGPLPSNPLLKQRCMSDPDMLLELSARAVLSNPAAGELADRFSVILHDLRMAGAWKRTNRRRLKRTEEMLCAHMSEQFRDDVVFLDVGASDGVTTLEALRALRQAFGPNVHAYVADINLSLLRYRCGPVTEYRAGDGEPIMVRVGPFGLRLANQRRGAAQTHGNLLARAYLRWQRLRTAMRLDTSISLVNPLSRSEPALTIIELDCLRRHQSLVGHISAIRASNILNLGYFEPAQIRQAVGHFHSYLRDGGCLVISRNADSPSGETENGSVWIREPGRFRPVADFGSGSETKALVDDWTPARPADMSMSRTDQLSAGGSS